jgi:hypothetical protein
MQPSRKRLGLNLDTLPSRRGRCLCVRAGHKARVLVALRRLLQTALPQSFHPVRGISARAWFSSAVATSGPPGSWSSRSAPVPPGGAPSGDAAQRRPRIAQRLLAAHAATLTGIGAMRVESIASQPNFTMPCDRACSSTCVKASFSARLRRRVDTGPIK